MNRLLSILVASLAATGAMAQTAGVSGSTSANGGASVQAPPAGAGATTGGALGASGGAIVEPGSTPATRASSGTSGSTSASTSANVGGASSTATMGAPAAPKTDDRHRHGRDATDADSDASTTMGNRDCPPGLAKKDNGCLPPGQARKLHPEVQH